MGNRSEMVRWMMEKMVRLSGRGGLSEQVGGYGLISVNN